MIILGTPLTARYSCSSDYNISPNRGKVCLDSILERSLSFDIEISRQHFLCVHVILFVFAINFILWLYLKHFLK